jgi:hypothetical protein
LSDILDETLHNMPTRILNLSSANLSKAAALQARIEALQTDLAKLLGSGEGAKPASIARKGRGKMSAAQRKKLSLAAKARWKKAKSAGRTRL